MNVLYDHYRRVTSETDNAQMAGAITTAEMALSALVLEENDVDAKDRITDRDLPLSFTRDRHIEPIEGISCITQTWRMKERMKTVSVALVLCLNVGVDPPDVVKTQPCARLECWIDPSTIQSGTKALEQIGNSLQAQYERWQPRARYKQSLDPTMEDVRKLCTSLRRNAKEERVLFHYNGHGVPKPTTNGEIWVFNRSYTQYIPLSIFDLQNWMGSPSIYVYDCSNAGIVVESFKKFALQHETEYEARGAQSAPPPNFRNCIQLAACSKDQALPMNPDLPADLFTSCLTTPIKVALRWFVLQPTAKLVPKVTVDLIDRIPGQITDRRTMLGELNWIFTAITDTIAWNTLPRDLFQKLFRQDLLVASLFRNFLLAERIMRSCDCTPISEPPLPPTFQHHMWNAWDLALDLSLGQLPGILNNDEPFVHLPFFEEQLTAFQVWLQLGSEHRNPPEQLPIVLQVLLSQVHRMRALELLGKFLDLGPWAVNLALSVGIFPYVLKLLQSCAKELRPLLVFIWAKILAVDDTCQADLVRDNGHKYFLSVLQDSSISNEYRTQAAFVLACIVNNYREGQEAALQGSLLSICLEQLGDASPHLRQWGAICLGRLWDHYEKAKWMGVRDTAHEKLYTLLHDPCPEVRAAAVYALGTFINSVMERSDHANTIDLSVVMALVSTVSGDMSSLVRRELVKAVQWVILAFEHTFVNVASQENVIFAHDSTRNTPTAMRRIGSRDRIRMTSPSTSHAAGIDTVDSAEYLSRVSSSSSISGLGHAAMGHGHSGSLGSLPGLTHVSVHMKVWAALCSLETDPHPEVAKMCAVITGYVRGQLRDQRESSESRLSNSISLPPSPNRGNYLSSESPPTLHPSDYRQPASRSTLPSRSRRLHHHTITEETDDRDHGLKRPSPLVTTQFVEWSCKRFAQPVNAKDKLKDVESTAYHEREWRFLRNTNIRKQASVEQRTLMVRKLEYQVLSTKCSNLPSVLQFHPFDQQIAVASKDNFFILDWGTGAKLTQCHCKSLKNANSKITSLEWINAHDLAMVMTASDDGSIKLWKPNVGSGNREASLVSAWQAFTTDLAPTFKLGQNVPCTTLLAWEQWTQTVIATGDTRLIRFFDAERELKAFDLPTGADRPVTCVDSTYASVSHELLSRTHLSTTEVDEGIIMGKKREERTGPRSGLVVVGCGDGSVRLFDRRCGPSEARVKTWMEHGGSVLGVQLRGNRVISGSVQGDVRIYDIRKSDSVQSTQVFHSNLMTSFAVHRNTNIYACGSQNQNIIVNTLTGNLVNSIKFYEGFMTYRTGPVSTLAFHPHKIALAAVTADSSLSIYCPEGRR